MVDIGLLILKLIEETYKVKFIGLIKLTKLKQLGYEIGIALNSNKDFLINTIIESNNTDILLKLLKNDLRSRRLNDSKFYTIKRSVNSDFGQFFNTQSEIKYKSLEEIRKKTLEVNPKEITLNVKGDEIIINVDTKYNWTIHEI